jgi:DNA adenine methylase
MSGRLNEAVGAAPIVKWVGGKTRLLPELMARMPLRYGTYYEPFAGGAALFFRLAPERAVINDLNAGLVGLYRTVRHNVDSVIAELEWHREQHSESHYYAQRDAWNVAKPIATLDDEIERAARFVYLNKTCFNGLWRVNRAGHFNVSMGRYTDPPICVPDVLRAAGAALSRATLCCGDYRTSLYDAKRGDFVYLDSPYAPMTPTANFTSYTADAFGADQQRELAAAARGLVSRGCKVMLSNSDTPFVRRLYKGFKIDRVKCSRSINSNASKRGAVNEVIIMGGYTRSGGAA